MVENKYVQIVDKEKVNNKILKLLERYGADCVFAERKIWFRLTPDTHWDYLEAVFSKYEINFYITKHESSLVNLDLVMKYSNSYIINIFNKYEKRLISEKEIYRYGRILESTINKCLDRNDYVEYNFPIYFNETCRESGVKNIFITEGFDVEIKPK